MAPGDRPWRCFVAVPIAAELRAVVQGVVRELRARERSDEWRWTDAEAWHVTLAFLGSTDPRAVPKLSAALDDVARGREAFVLHAGGVGAFPSRGSARVLWYGVADPRGELRTLARDVSVAVGLQDEGRFRAHLTLARARDRFGAGAFGLLEVAAPEAPLQVDRLILFRSHLGQGPARYEPLFTARLRGAVA